LSQAVGFWNEVGVEDREQLALGDPQSVLKCPGLETRAVGSMDVMNVETLLCVLGDGRLSNIHGFVSRVVQHLYFKLLAWVVDLRYCFYESLDHVHLVE